MDVQHIPSKLYYYSPCSAIYCSKQGSFYGPAFVASMGLMVPFLLLMIIYLIVIPITLRRFYIKYMKQNTEGKKIIVLNPLTRSKYVQKWKEEIIY